MSLEAEIVIYTDGSCEPNPGPGGWGAILLCDTPKGIHEREIGGYKKKATNNRMELLAVIESIEALKWPCDIIIYSDSQYVVKGVGNWKDGKPTKNGWMVGWKERKWKRKDGKLINIDLWQRIYKLAIKQHSIKMRWVKGHAGNEYNERCDQLALKQRLRNKK